MSHFLKMRFIEVFNYCELHSKELMSNKVQWISTIFTREELENIRIIYNNEINNEYFIYYGYHGLIYLLLFPIHIIRFLLFYPDSHLIIIQTRKYIDFIDIMLSNMKDNQNFENEVLHHPIIF